MTRALAHIAAAALTAALASTGAYAVHLLATECATEDANGCTWYADTNGNGHGDTYAALPDGSTITLAHTPDERSEAARIYATLEVNRWNICLAQ